MPRHWWLAFRTSIIGAMIGMVPGLGGSAAAWMCYGHAVQTSKTPERFGKGAVEGVIAPETASNAKEGGSLLPTLFFGIPGSLRNGGADGGLPHSRYSAGTGHADREFCRSSGR